MARNLCKGWFYATAYHGEIEIEVESSAPPCLVMNNKIRQYAGNCKINDEEGWSEPIKVACANVNHLYSQLLCMVPIWSIKDNK